MKGYPLTGPGGDWNRGPKDVFFAADVDGDHQPEIVIYNNQTLFTGVLKWTPSPPPKTGIVPDVTNFTPSHAKAAIVDAGFGFSEAIDTISGVPKFSPYVEDQDPGGGSEAQLGTVVAVTVAVWASGGSR
jgi:hypothetical protein